MTWQVHAGPGYAPLRSAPPSHAHTAAHGAHDNPPPGRKSSIDGENLWVTIQAKSREMAVAEAMAKPSVSDEVARGERAEKLGIRLPQLRQEAEEAWPSLINYQQALQALAMVDGERHVLALLLQRCQWRRWGRLRMERIQVSRLDLT
jgi:hypothetical protein